MNLFHNNRSTIDNLPYKQEGSDLLFIYYLITSNQVSVDLLTSEPVCSDTTVLPLPSRQNHEWYTEQITVNIVQNILQPQKYTVYKWFETFGFMSFDRCSVETEWTRESGSVRQLSSWGSAAGQGQLRSGTEEVPISLWPWGEAPGYMAGRPLPDLLPTSWELLSAGAPPGPWLGHHLAAGPGSAVGPVPWFSLFRPAGWCPSPTSALSYPQGDARWLRQGLPSGMCPGCKVLPRHPRSPHGPWSTASHWLSLHPKTESLESFSWASISFLLLLPSCLTQETLPNLALST